MSWHRIARSREPSRHTMDTVSMRTEQMSTAVLCGGNMSADFHQVLFCIQYENCSQEPAPKMLPVDHLELLSKVSKSRHVLLSLNLHNISYHMRILQSRTSPHGRRTTAYHHVIFLPHPTCTEQRLLHRLTAKVIYISPGNFQRHLILNTALHWCRALDMYSFL